MPPLVPGVYGHVYFQDAACRLARGRNYHRSPGSASTPLGWGAAFPPVPGATIGNFAARVLDSLRRRLRPPLHQQERVLCQFPKACQEIHEEDAITVGSQAATTCAAYCESVLGSEHRWLDAMCQDKLHWLCYKMSVAEAMGMLGTPAILLGAPAAYLAVVACAFFYAKASLGESVTTREHENGEAFMDPEDDRLMEGWPWHCLHSFFTRIRCALPATWICNWLPPSPLPIDKVSFSGERKPPSGEMAVTEVRQHNIAGSSESSLLFQR
eukprot:2011888-Amphidinium_carterae.1